MCNKRVALSVAGVVFALVAGLHFFRYSKAWVVMVNDSPVPLEWSMYGSIVSAVLAVYMFYAAMRK